MYLGLMKGIDSLPSLPMQQPSFDTSLALD